MPLLPRYDPVRRQRERQAWARQVAELEAEPAPPELVRASAAGGDGERLRGVPILTRGTRGTMRGSDPLAELLRRERANGRG